MPTTYKGLNVPVSTDLADGPTAFTQYTDTIPFQIFATVAARDAWANPPNGAMCVTVDTYTQWLRRGGVWSQLTPVQYTATLSGTVPSVSPVQLGTTITIASVTYARRVSVSGMCIFGGAPAGFYQLWLACNMDVPHDLYARGPANGGVTCTVSSVEFSLPANTAGTVQAFGIYSSGTNASVTVAGDPKINRMDAIARGV